MKTMETELEQFARFCDNYKIVDLKPILVRLQLLERVYQAVRARIKDEGNLDVVLCNHRQLVASRKEESDALADVLLHEIFFKDSTRD